MRLRHNHSGFTLIEVMIVVVIIGILATIAYPAYTRYVQDSAMATTQGDLMELAQWMERQYTLNNTYAGLATGDLPFAISPRDPTSTTRYTITLGGVGANTFILTAARVGPQAGHRCGSLTLDQAGNRGTVPAADNCWR